MLRRKDSIKVLKGIKAIAFATSLSLLNPVSVEAMETSLRIENDDFYKKTFVNTSLGLAFVTSLGVITVYNYKLSKNSFDYNKVKLNDSSVSNEEVKVEDIKIICK